MTAKLRLDKYLSDMLGETRSNVKDYIKKGKVTINGNIVKSSDTKVEKGRDTITFDGREIFYTDYYYYILNKPAGVITSTEKGRTKTVMDVLLEAGMDCPFFHELSPVGRLDKDTVGLLFFTNDGELNHRLLSPRYHVDKTYYAETDLDVEEDDIEYFKKGLDLGDFVSLPAKLQILENKKNSLVTIREGKFHQVKRMFEAVGKQVVFLKRISMGNLILEDSLKEGEYRELSEKEVEELKASVGLE